MALTNVYGNGGPSGVLSLALSPSYLSPNYIAVSRATRFDLWLDDNTIAYTFKVSFDGGSTFSAEVTLAAGTVYEFGIPRGQTLTLDIKSASGTPKAGGFAYGDD